MNQANLRKLLLRLSLALFLLPIAAIQAQDSPIWTAAQDAKLVSEIGQSQTIGGVTLTLNWVYVDPQRLAVNYTVETTEDQNVYDLFSPYSTYPMLGDAEGSNFSYSNSALETGENTHQRTTTVEYYSQAVRQGEGTDDWIIDNDYFATHFESLPGTLNMKFELTLGGFTVDDTFYLPEGSTLKPGDMVDAIGPFLFEFSALVHPALTLEPNQSIEAKGLEMTLESVSITPMQTTARVCYDMPDSQDWMPQATLTLDGEAAMLTGMSITGSKEDIALETDRRCRDLSFQVFHEDAPDSLTLDVDSLATSMMEGPDEWEQIKQVLAKQGIDIQVNFETSPQGGGGIGIDVLKIPDGVDFNDAVDAAREQLGKIMRGPWTFTLDLP
jgi:hypothetical protein